MGVYRKLKQPCFCGNAPSDWHSCTCPRSDEFYVRFEVMGEVIQQKLTGITTEKEALTVEQGMERKAKQGHGQELLDFMRERKCRDTFCRIGTILDAAMDPDSGIFKDPKYARRYCQALLLVIARGLDMWTVYDGSAKTFGRKLGSQIADEVRIRKLSSSVLDGDLVRKYFRACTGRLDWNRPFPENTSANSTLGHARCLFTEKMRTLKLDHLKFPPALTKEGGFLRHALLPELQPEPAPLTIPEFQAIVEAAEKFKDHAEFGHRYIINLALRQTGLRSGSVEHVHRDWVHKFNEGYMMEVRKVKGGTAQYSIPITEELATMILASEDYLIPGDDAARGRLVQEHGTWMASLVAAPARGFQSNHRLRDTVAAICYSWLGRDAAVEMLGHSSRAINAKSYARLRIDVSDLMKTELAHAQRAVHRPENAA